MPFICENLKAPPVEYAEAEGPLVSIVMPAYNSAATIGYALESLRTQSYRNIEVIVVDDSSSDETRRIVSQLTATDPRFRLIGLERNAGTYVARNLALAAAEGEYVTTQDADDWAHPQKIAMAVAVLQRDASIVATWVKHIRCSSRQGFRALSGYIRPDASSLMFRRKPVMERAGWYDSVRAAGDGEFHLRVERVFGRRSIRQIDKLLSFVSWSEGSLSGSGEFEIDSDLGIFSPSRSAYRRSFGLWHETANSLFMPFPLESRPFAAPDVFLPARGESSEALFIHPWSGRSRDGSPASAPSLVDETTTIHPSSRKII
ncbi:glycosyltransferase family 2 protein [Microvirga sp. TS319]|uniref:glycosyltransferase family 2 protein n=1 Tax=Microvirga sp. TS319 TaxID=3241165 RepID=UPI00351A274A